MTSRNKISKEYIDNLLREYDTTIIEYPEQLGSKSNVKFICGNKNCNEQVEKQVRYIQKNGAYCKTCLLSNQELRKKLPEKNTQPKKEYNRKYVFELLHTSSATLDKDIEDNIDRDTQIYYRCHCRKIGNKHNKSIRNIEISGAYCEDCINENAKSKRIKTNQEKYGVEHTYELNNVKQD